MTFDEVLEQALEMLRRRGRVSYRALKVQFHLDDDLLEVLKEEIVAVHQLGRDQEGTMFVWTGDTAPAVVPVSPPTPDPVRAPLTYTPPYLAEKIFTSRAAARSANREALAYFEQGLAALTHLPETHETQEQAIDLRFDLRNALFPLAEFGRIDGYLREAETLARKLDDQRRLGWVSAYMSAAIT